ncbi:hypothetical protein V6N11_047798 [Hibiscus sabdariffa]|uniref:Uncharacterized protein n=1 Tax=Hibiscus sabdariffa TaxID=183260 RepID=A0ABR2P827_9ROSI
MQRLEKQELHVHEPINVCCKARIWAKEEINGRVKYEFDILFDYATALRQADPNCNVDLMVVSQRKSSRIANLSPKSKSKALGACSTREVNDVKGKGKAKEQPRTQAIRPMRKLQFPNTKDKFQKRKQPWK